MHFSIFFFDSGYPHDCRADKNPYPHDRRADNDSYPHDSNNQCIILTRSAVITHDVTTGIGYCLVGFNWIIDFFN